LPYESPLSHGGNIPTLLRHSLHSSFPLWCCWAPSKTAASIPRLPRLYRPPAARILSSFHRQLSRFHPYSRRFTLGPGLFLHRQFVWRPLCLISVKPSPVKKSRHCSRPTLSLFLRQIIKEPPGNPPPRLVLPLFYSPSQEVLSSPPASPVALPAAFRTFGPSSLLPC